MTWSPQSRWLAWGCGTYMLVNVVLLVYVVLDQIW